MAGSRKRKFYEVSDENIAIQKFKRYHQKICDASIDLPIEKPIRRMNRILIDSKDDVFIFVISKTKFPYKNFIKKYLLFYRLISRNM